MQPDPPTQEPTPDDEVEYDQEQARAFLAGGAYATVAIDRADDLAAIFGKIDAAASPRVALVAARGNHELQRSLSMRRLQRHLDLHGKDLILVSRSRALRLRAREEDLPAVGALRRVNFAKPRRAGLNLGWLTLRLPTLGGLIAACVLVGAALAGVAAVLWYLPKGKVTVFVPSASQDAALELLLDTQANAVNPEKLIVPAKRREITVTRSFFRPATGVVQIPTSNAGVAVRFTNRTNAAVRVPKGTVVIAQNNVRFTVASDVDLPRFNATGDAIALAQTAGTVGNIPVNTATRIEGELAQRVAVTNPTPGEKGTDTPQQVIAEGDVEGVRGFAVAVLTDAARQELLLRLADTATVFGASAIATVTELVAQPAANSPGAYTEVKVTARVSMLTVDDTDLRQVYVRHFRPLIAADQMLLEEDFTTTVERAGEADRTLDKLPVSVRVVAVTAPFLDRADLQQALAGKSKRGAETLIRDRIAPPLPPLVEISPEWAPRLPRRTSQIDVVFSAVP